MNFELEQLLQQRIVSNSSPNQPNGGTGPRLHYKHAHDRSHDHADEGSLDILEHLISIILQENSAYLEQLLQNEEVLDVLDMQDNKGFTPLHIACDKYDVDCCRLLLQAGANPNVVDNYGRTALHWVVSAGCHCEACNARRAQCTRLLVQARTNIEVEDHFGDTPLFYAANNLQSQSAVVLLESGADTSRTNSKGVNCAQLLVQKIPFVMVQLLDSCITYDEEDNAELKIDFSVLIDSAVTSTKDEARSRRSTGRETELLTCMLQAYPIAREELLTHPVTQTFLCLKWQYVRKWFWFIRLFYCLLTLLFTFFVYNFYVHQCPYHANHDKSELRSLEFIARPLYPCQQGPFELPFKSMVMLGCICAWLVLMFLNQLNMAIVDCKNYVKGYGFLALGWWVVIIVCGLTVLPTTGLVPLNYWAYPLAAFSIFWTWSMHLTHLNRLPYLAPYISMFRYAVRRAFIIIGVFASLFMAFVLGFCVLFPQHGMFQHIPVATLKMFLMALGDQHFARIFKSNETETLTNDEERLMDIDYSLPTQLFYLAFMIVFGILMLNILVGLAASDVYDIRKDAALFRAERQIIEIARLETFLATSWFCVSKCTKKGFLSLMAVEDRSGRVFNFAPTDPDADTSLPPTLKAKFIPFLSTRPCYRATSGSGSGPGRGKKIRSLEAQPTEHSRLPALRHSQSFRGTQTQTRGLGSETIDSILADLRARLEGLSAGGTLQRRNTGQRRVASPNGAGDNS